MDEKQAAAKFTALAQETRVRLLRLLSSAGATGMGAGELHRRTGVPASTLSFHLSALEQAGLVQSTRQGRTSTYAIRFVGLRDLLTFITETCCAGQPDLCGDIARLLPEIEIKEVIMTGSFNVLFLCTHNSARSIIAEAILNKIGNGRFRAYSAGSDPVAEPNAEVLENLKRLDHDISNARSKSWDEFVGPDAPVMDFVIALCDTTEGQVCPEFGDRVVSASWPLPDPAMFTGTQTERQVLLNQLYSMINRRLGIFVNLPFDSLDRLALTARLDELGYSSPANA
tara:strand:+ start:15929 stop:16780 length:852 start_codon:yes stop_codon:yes gene_type:complete